MAIIDDGSGNLELTGKHLKDYVKKRFSDSDLKNMELPVVTSKIDELTNEIIELNYTIRLLKQKLEYHKLS